MRLLAAAVLLVGCVAPAGPDEEPAWTDAEAPPWFTWTTGCSACGAASSQHPQAQTLVVYRDGALLWFDFGLQSRGGNTSFEPGFEPWADEVEAVRALQHDGWHDAGIHVFSIRAARADGWPAIEAELARQHGELQEPPPPPNNCADCSWEWIEAFGPHVHGGLRENYAEGGAWDRVLAHMRALRTQTDA